MRVFELIKKDFLIDWRQQSPFIGILLYLSSTIFTSYMAFGGLISNEVWNALFWIILVFTSVNALSKNFSQEQRRTHYYYYLCKPTDIIIGKLLYACTYLLTLTLIGFFLYQIFLGAPEMNIWLYLLNLLLGCIGLSAAFTMISAISAKASNQSVLMAILGFPVIIPILILAINNSNKILQGFIWMQIQGNIISLLSVDVIIIAISFVLFPFTWKS